jgi:hypothetical protein
VTPEQQLDAKYRTTQPEQALPDPEYTRLQDLTPEQLLALPSGKLDAYLATAKWHADRRMTMDSTDGIVIGGRSYEDYAADG